MRKLTKCFRFDAFKAQHWRTILYNRKPPLFLKSKIHKIFNENQQHFKENLQRNSMTDERKETQGFALILFMIYDFHEDNVV